MSNESVVHIEFDNSVDSALTRMRVEHAQVPLRCVVVVAINDRGNPRCFQGGEASCIEMSGLLHHMATGIEMDGLTGEPEEDDAADS